MTRKKNQKNKKLRLKILMLALLVSIAAFEFLLLSPKTQNKEKYQFVTVMPRDVRDSIIRRNKEKEAALRAKPYRIPILVYHYVEYVKDPKDTIRKSLDTYPSTLDEQIKTLAGAGYTSITMADLEQTMEGKKQPPAKPIILTFDDGYRDFYTDVFPILKKHGAKAVAYLVPNFLDKPNNMDWVQVQEIVKSGLVEVGAHTMNHAYLKGMQENQAFDEIKNSKLILEKKLGVPVKAFAYPYGAFDLPTVNLVKKAGLDTSVTEIHGYDQTLDNKYFLYRLKPGNLTGQALLNFLEKEK